ncbi:MAG TPA: hypothetical protein VMV98_07850 [Acidobacteriaceae bacterium]|nr:hypothetical protein [Acidobacteriaceae bacterium]
MATMHNTYEPQYLKVVHPLDDVCEQKCSSEGLGRIKMTLPVRISLGVLRAYLVAMTLMLGYHVLDLAGLFH